MTTNNNLPNLSQLKKLLKISPINTNQNFTHNGQACGSVYDNNEGLHAQLGINGKIQLRSGVEMTLDMYRGQNQDYTRCVPTLAREKSIAGKLLKLCQRIAFEDAIGDHPFVRLVEATPICNYLLDVDREGLAQHYGLATDMLDVTDNFDVACFFASCQWNSNTGKHEPILRPNHPPGVIYVINWTMLFDPDPTDSSKISTHCIGWQPLPRPEQQRAYAIKLPTGHDLRSTPAVMSFGFRHDPRVSLEIWHSFDQGEALFPSDAAAELSKQANQLRDFTQRQIDRSWTRLDTWEKMRTDERTRETVEAECGITIVDKPFLDWSLLGVETCPKRLKQNFQEVCNRIRFRRAAYPVRGVTTEKSLPERI